MTNNEIKNAILAGIEGKALYLGSTLVWKKDEGVVIEDTFDTFDPEMSSSRLVEPTSRYAVLNNTLSENKRSFNIGSAAVADNGILQLKTFPQENTIGGTTKQYVTSLVFSQKMFSTGRLDIRAKFVAKNSIKCSIWATTTPIIEPLTGLKYVFEFDVVEYQKRYFGINNTSRGMWTWQANSQSASAATRLPYSYTDPDTGVVHYYTYDSWTWSNPNNAWIWADIGRVNHDGNILVGHNNGKRYRITNTERGVYVNSADLTWEREDGVTGTGLDGNTYFSIPSSRGAIGGGEVTTTLLNNTIDMRDWHVWSIVLGENYVAYECDGEEYWRKTNSDLFKCIVTEDTMFNIIFSIPNVQDPTNEIDSTTGEVDDGIGNMEVDWIKYTPN